MLLWQYVVQSFHYTNFSEYFSEPVLSWAPGGLLYRFVGNNFCLLNFKAINSHLWLVWL